MSVNGEELRALVRQVIREALPETAASAPAQPAPSPVRSAPAVVEPVSLRSDADLDAFVRRILDAAADPVTSDALRTGRVRFVLAGAAGGSTGTSSDPRTTGYRVEKGAVTERHVKAAVEAGGPLVLGKAAVLTPLARDRVRAAGLKIERES